MESRQYVVLDRVPDSYKYKFIGNGANGRCYLTSEGEVYIEFGGRLCFKDSLDIMTGLNNPFFAF